MPFSIRQAKNRLRAAINNAREQALDVKNSAAEWIDSKFETRAERAQASHLKKLTETLDAVRDDAEKMAEELATTRARLETEKVHSAGLRLSLDNAREAIRRWKIAAALAIAGGISLAIVLAAGLA